MLLLAVQRKRYKQLHMSIGQIHIICNHVGPIRESKRGSERWRSERGFFKWLIKP